MEDRAEFLGIPAGIPAVVGGVALARRSLPSLLRRMKRNVEKFEKTGDPRYYERAIKLFERAKKRKKFAEYKDKFGKLLVRLEKVKSEFDKQGTELQPKAFIDEIYACAENTMLYFEGGIEAEKSIRKERTIYTNEDPYIFLEKLRENVEKYSQNGDPIYYCRALEVYEEIRKRTKRGNPFDALKHKFTNLMIKLENARKKFIKQ